MPLSVNVLQSQGSRNVETAVRARQKSVISILRSKVISSELTLEQLEFKRILNVHHVTKRRLSLSDGKAFPMSQSLIIVGFSTAISTISKIYI